LSERERHISLHARNASNEAPLQLNPRERTEHKARQLMYETQ
jgi:hypothetical protein